MIFLEDIMIFLMAFKAICLVFIWILKLLTKRLDNINEKLDNQLIEDLANKYYWEYVKFRNELDNILDEQEIKTNEH